jgi:RimJ/RimL family protein N-acetyltransferase
MSGVQSTDRARHQPDIRVESPFPAFAIPRVWVWVSEFRHRVCDDYSPKTLEAFVDLWEAGDRTGRKRWAVYRDGELCGVITVQRLSPVLSDAHYIFAKRAWGAETTLASLRIVFARLFMDGATKISSTLFADNRSIISLIRRLGGSVEGRLVNQTMRGGKPVDMVAIGIQKDAFVGSIEGVERPDGSGAVELNLDAPQQPDQSGEQKQPAAEAVESEVAELREVLL